MLELYKFETAAEQFYFTTTIFSRVFGGNTYIPVAVKRGAVNLNENVLKSQVTFAFPLTNTFAKRCLGEYFEGRMLVTVYQEGIVFWKGRVISADLQDNIITLKADSSVQSLTRQSSGARFSRYCWKSLYSEACGLSKVSKKATFSVISVSGRVISVSTGQPDNTYYGGIAELQGQARRIVSQTATTITLQDSFTGVLSGNLDIYPGCTLTKTNCDSLGNGINFGGFSYIPTKNPIGNTGLF